MKLNFILEKNILIQRLLISHKEHDGHVTDFQNEVWNQSEIKFNILAGRYGLKELQNLKEFREIPDFLEKIQSLDTYGRIFNETQKYRDYCQQGWERSHEQSEKVIHSITQFDLNRAMDVYIVHPSLKEGMHYGVNSILWGHEEEWPHYICVYLWHEILHEYFEKNDVNHALIQLIADNELRVVLNGGEYPPYEGHPNLFPIMDRVLPIWRAYMGTRAEDRNFGKFCSRIKEKFNATEKEI